jgi:hypothetical protein
MIAVIGIVISACWGCSGSKEALQDIPPTILTLTPDNRHLNRMALVLTQTPDTPIGRHMGERYVQTLADTLREESRRLQLLTLQDPELPEFFANLARQATEIPDTFALSAQARMAGYNGWAAARIASIRTDEKKSGILWFRTIRYFVFFDLNLTVYDAFTGAKLFDEIVEHSLKISSDEYDAYKAGEWADLQSLDEAIVDLASDLGENAAEVLNDQPWRAAVVRVQDDRIFVSAGSLVGVSVGDRLAVLEGRRILQGQNGEKFIVPGYQVGEIEIVGVSEQQSEGKDLGREGASRIQAGDVAIAIR